MDSVTSPPNIENQQPPKPQTHSAQNRGLVSGHGISIDVEPPTASSSDRPQLVKHISTPAYDSPLRHHRRTPSAPRKVKESLNARSEYVTSEDDGSAQHRINQYIIKQEIGRGSFGAVHLATDQYGEEYAVKEFSKSRLRKRAQSHILRSPRASRQRGSLGPGEFNSPLHRNPTNDPDALSQVGTSIDLIRQEIAIMKKLNHPNLVSLIEVLDDPKEDSLYMVLEMCKKGVVMKVGLGETSDPYSEEQCRCWFRDLILGIEYLHAQGIVHRDIKPDNCLLTKEDVLKVVDFGVSEIFEKDSQMLTAKSAGSPAYLPPELCVVRHGGISGKAADIWSMGVTLYCLRYGRIPFEKSAILELYESIKNDDLVMPSENNDSFRDLMHKILEKDPEKRIQMLQLREHPWVTRNGFDPLLPAAENTSELIEPPTAEELNGAITGKMENLITVMKAVHKFKNLIAQKRPPVMNSILGEEGSLHMSQPPLAMRPDSTALPHLQHKSHSEETFDRRPVEGVLASEGVHRNPLHAIERHNIATGGASDTGESSRPGADLPLQHADSAESGRSMPLAVDASPLKSPSSDRNAYPPFKRIHPTLSPGSQQHAQTFDEIGRRGHAHDPLQDHLYLYIGPSTFSDASNAQDQQGSFVPDDDSVPIVSESPGAAEIDIYETAYRDEIERIRARIHEEGKEEEDPEVYLTRRVDARLMAIGGFAGRMRARGEEVSDKFKDIRGLREGKARVTGVSRALRAVAREEYVRHKQERRARETAETAKAEADKARKAEQQNPDNKQTESKYSEATEESPGERPSGSRSQPSLFSSASLVGAKAWEKGRQAKSSFKGIYGRARQFSKQDPAPGSEQDE